MSVNNDLLNIYLKEYESLKKEQLSRIGFRDNLIYVNFVVIGGIVSFAFAQDNYVLLLIIPFVSIVLGWTYVVNDEKISAIGRYIRTSFTVRIRDLIKQHDDSIFAWEIVHRSDKRRKSRKITQFLIDEFTFFVPGILSIFVFYVNSTDLPVVFIVLALIEALLQLTLGIHIFIYADFKRNLINLKKESAGKS